MAQKIGFFVLPKGSSAGSRGQRVGELNFATPRDRDVFVRGVSMLTDVSIGPLFTAGGASLSSKEAGALVAKIDKAISSGGESTLSSVLSAEVVEMEQGALEGKLDQFCEILKATAKTGGFLTSLPE